MATFMEAIEAAKKGKIISLDGHRYRWSRTDDVIQGSLVTDDELKLHPQVTYWLLHGPWIIEEPQPKEYTFLEAVEMMEQGKVMAPVCTAKLPLTKKCKISNGVLTLIGNCDPYYFRVDEIKDKWIEV